MSARLTFVGTGEALDPALPNTSLLLEGPRSLLLDCGYAVPHAFWRVSQDPNLLDGIWISHAHADHWFGLPALLLWMRLAGRERPLALLGGPGFGARVQALLELGYPGSYAPHKCYPLELHELDPGQTHSFGPLSLRVATSAHSVANYALRAEAPGMRSLMYSGDGAPTPQTRALAQGVEVLVHECFFPTAVDGRARKHGDLPGCIELARAAGVETLALLHFAAETKSRLRERALELASGEEFALCLPTPGERLAL